MGVEEMKLIASLIKDVSEDFENKETLKEVKDKVKSLTSSFPLYPEWLHS